MEIKFVGIKESRQNISDFAKEENLDSLFKDILMAKKDIKEGNVHSEEDILAEYS